MSSYNGRKLCSKCTNALWSRGKVWLYCRIEPDAARGWVLVCYAGWQWLVLQDKGGTLLSEAWIRAMDQIHGSGKGGAPFILHFRLSSARCVGHLVNILKYFRSYLFPHTEESLNFLAD